MIDKGNLTFRYLATFGLRDNLREKIKSCVKYAKEHSKIEVRLISGDHIETAKAVALKVGILQAEETSKESSFMSGDDFFKKLFNDANYNDMPTTIEDMQKLFEENPKLKKQFNRIMHDLRVLGRANSKHKQVLVQGLECLKKKVATTGDGIADIDALKQSTVGISMASGVAACKF